MQTLVYLPQLELNMENVRVASVQVQVGESVTPDQPLIEVETEKAVQPVPAPKGGVVRRLYVRPDDRLGERAVICLLTDCADEPFTESPSPQATSLETSHPGPPQDNSRASGGSSKPIGEDEPVRAAPAARKMAKDLGLDLRAIPGTGPEGRITVQDVERARATGTTPPSQDSWTPLSSARLALIAQMQKSLAEIPQFQVARQLAAAALLGKSDGITITARLVRAAALALEKHPALRTTLLGEKVRVAPVSVALAMQTSRGLLAPALRAKDLSDLDRVAHAIRDLRARAEAGTLRRDELSDAPFALSNLGMFQVDLFHAFVFHGQTAVLAVGRVDQGKAWFSLSADHRIVDGVEAARFLETLKGVIQ